MGKIQTDQRKNRRLFQITQTRIEFKTNTKYTPKSVAKTVYLNVFLEH